MAAQAVLGGELAYVSDLDAGACKILDHRFPGVPNLGDLKVIDWASLGPIDVLTAGYPCQPFSHAGGRKGTEDERHLWPYIREAIRVLRPRYTLLENVAGHRSLGFDRVLGDLAEDGMHVRWTSVRASDVGGCHQRERVFILVTPDVESDAWGLDLGDSRTPADAEGDGWNEGWTESARLIGRPDAAIGGLLPTPRTSDTNGAGEHGTGGLDLRTAVDQLPTPTARDHKGHNQRRDTTSLTGALLPTPAVNDMGEGKTVEAWDEWTAKMRAKHRNGNGHGPSLAIEAQRTSLLPTTTATDARASGGNSNVTDTHHAGTTLTDAAVRQPERWGKYAEAIARWESVTRPAPEPTELGPKGAPRLSAEFSSWMMGLPDGWITDVPGITRTEALKAAGNGVVPQQAVLALQMLLAIRLEAIA